MIHYNVPPYVGTETEYIKEAISNNKICGDGQFTKKCNQWIEEHCHTNKALLTTSGTSALEMCAMLCDLNPDDEIILPSFTFPSTATCFVASKARLVFVDIRPDTMNIDESLIENAITEKTKAICVVHYAGVSCEMDRILDIAKRHNLYLIEDAAQAILSTYKGRLLGSIGDFSALSFHETKNYSMGEGGAILINKEEYVERAEIIREKGTNRSQFFRGEVAKYNWIDKGSSYLPSDLNAAYLWGQLYQWEIIYNKRISIWNTYNKRLSELAKQGDIELPVIPENCEHNGHIFYIKCRDLNERTAFIDYMKSQDVLTPFHYVPLHSSPGGLKFGRFNGVDKYTTRESERLARLPLYYGLTEEEQDYVIDRVYRFFGREE